MKYKEYFSVLNFDKAMPSVSENSSVNKRHGKHPGSPKPTQQSALNTSAETTLKNAEQSSSANDSDLKKLNGNVNNDANAALLNVTGVKTLLLVTALACVCLTGFMTRLFSVIRYESIIHEFDPWYLFIEQIRCFH